jgi:Na+/proline symporter
VQVETEMNESILQAMIIAVSISFCVFGFLARGQPTSVINDIQRFSIGNGNRSAFPIAAGISMSFVGGAATLNMASLGYQYGWSVLVDPICVGLGLVLCIIAASRIRAGKGITISGLLAGSSLPLQVLLGVASSAIYLMLTAAQFVAIGKLLSPYFPGIDTSIIIFSFAAVVFSYIYFRGFEAVTNTDILQFFLVLLLFALPAITVLIGSIRDSSIGSQLPEPTPASLLIYLGLPLFFVPVSHDTNLRAKAAVSSNAAKFGFALGALFYCLFVAVAIGIGVYLREAGVVLAAPETALPTFFKMHLGIVGALSVVAVLAAIVSTLDSFGFDAVISLANDVAKPLRVGSDRRVIALSVAVVIIGSLLISLSFPKILGLILGGMLLYISLFIPIAAGKLISVPDSLLVATSSITIVTLVATKVAGVTLPLEPLAFVGIHFALILIARTIPTK